ncbi:MAG: hypothetical protein EXR47_04155 [Dehalococcoidia bacterium]|nr:hypothetical protein [Dehalococcoidia bacterium]
MEKPEGRQVFKRLVGWADIVVETFEPGYLDRLGLGYEALRAINPRVIVTSITPFGQTGPYVPLQGVGHRGPGYERPDVHRGRPRSASVLHRQRKRLLGRGVLGRQRDNADAPFPRRRRRRAAG